MAWTDPDVQRWFEKNNQILRIDIQQVSVLMSLNFNEVDMLEKEEWKNISSDYGCILFDFWKNNQTHTFAETGGVKEHHEGT